MRVKSNQGRITGKGAASTVGADEDKEDEYLTVTWQIYEDMKKSRGHVFTM